MKPYHLGVIIVLTLATTVKADYFEVVNLVTDDQTANAALLTDPNLKNAWGISMTATGPFWVSANGSGVSTIYQVSSTNLPTKLGLEVAIPGDGSVTGQVHNSNSGAFNADTFLFVSEDGTVSGWRGTLGSTAEVLQTSSPDNVYKGTTEATIGGHTYLYAANFRAGTIDVLKGTFGAPDLAGTFTDPNLPAGYAPFNIQNLGGTLYVTYALQDDAKQDDVAGAGFGFVNAFDTNGSLLGRVATQGTLNSPWGLAIAPDSFGEFAGDLLVGNFGDGKINVFDTTTNVFQGQLSDVGGQPLSIDGLWGLAVGNNGSAGTSESVYFSAGPGGESNGLFGVILSVPEPSTVALLGSGTIALFARALRRRKRF